MAKKQIEHLNEREARLKKELEQVKNRKRQEEAIEREKRRKKVNHAKYIVAGRMLEIAKEDPSNDIWDWARKTINDEHAKNNDRTSLQALLEEYKIDLTAPE